MIDTNSQFFAILTAVGEAKQANADALGIPWKLTNWVWGMPTAPILYRIAPRPS